MNYYEHHIGDYAEATSHLSFIEDAAYSRLIRKYYASEKPLPADIKTVQRLIGARTKEEREAVATVLEEFFILHEDGWHNHRCDQEIERYQDKQTKAKRSAQVRWNKAGTHSDSNANAYSDSNANAYSDSNANASPNAMRTHSEGNAHQTPDTRHQLNTIEANASCPIDPSGQSDPDVPPAEKKTPKPPGLPDCPYTRLLALWAKHLPHLAQPRSWEGNRKTTMRQRWQQAAKPSAYSPKGYATEAEGVAWWDSFFSYIANGTRLSAGFESQNRTWVPDLEWVCNATNFQKIIDGKYEL
jgi:uncharacterized protein YdaU (DUF1376 family)